MLFRSAEYLALNPEGKMPLLVSDDITLPESDTICRYLLDRFGDTAPSFMPSSAASRARSDLLCRLHDMYLTTIQGAMYKATPPFGIFGSRLDALQELREQVERYTIHCRMHVRGYARLLHDSFVDMSGKTSSADWGRACVPSS